MARLAPLLRQRYVDNNGDPLAGGKVYTYVANTSTPLVTYTDSTGATPNSNPVILDSSGSADIWTGTGIYKFVITDANDVVQDTIDNVNNNPTTATDGIDGRTVLNGIIDPVIGDGNDGDFFINTVAHTLFGPKASGAWPSGVSLVGPAGTLTDGDYGDIVISGTGTAINFDSSVVTTAAKTVLDDTTVGAMRTTLGVGTTDNPQFATIELGAATDTTISRASAGDVAVEGNRIFRVGGTDVPIADGGTGASTKAAAFDALSPMTTSGDIIYGGASGTGTRLAKGSDTQVLTLASGVPTWASPSSGGNLLIYHGEFNGGATNYWSTTAAAPTFTIPSPTGTPTLTQLKNSNAGTVSIATVGSIAPGFTFTAGASYTSALIEIAVMVQNSSNTGSVNLELYENGSSTAIGHSGAYYYNPAYFWIITKGYMNLVSGSTYTFVLRMHRAGGAGTLTIGALDSGTQCIGSVRLECR